MVRILAVASAGGHFRQLCIALQLVEQDHEVYFATTRPDFTPAPASVEEIPDFSRESPFRAIVCIHRVWRIITKTQATVVISTGAAPGLIAVAVGRACGLRTIWIDSCANVERVSLSGRIAAVFVHECLVQWTPLATGRFKFIGRVL